MERLKTSMAVLIVITAILAYLYMVFPSPAKRGAVHLDISSDGNYVISNHLGDYLVLWDIKKKQSKVISTHANQVAAYFIKDRYQHQYLWQDLMDNTVYISNAEKVDKHQRYHKLDFAVYGHVMTKDKRTYIASDINFNIFKIQGFERKK